MIIALVGYRHTGLATVAEMLAKRSACGVHSIKCFTGKADDDAVVIDVDAVHEAEALRAAGALIVRVVRSGVAVDDDDPAHALDDFDFDAEFGNDSPLWDLRSRVARLHFHLTRIRSGLSSVYP